MAGGAIEVAAIEVKAPCEYPGGGLSGYGRRVYISSGHKSRGSMRISRGGDGGWHVGIWQGVYSEEISQRSVVRGV